MDFESRDDVIVWMIHTQIGRRNLAAAQRIELALLSESTIARKAKEKQIQGGKEKVVQETAQAKTRNPKTREQVAHEFWDFAEVKFSARRSIA